MKKIFITALFACSVFSMQAATKFVTNANDAGAGSLRDAINTAAPGDTIDFSGLAGPAPVKINLVTALNPVFVPITIDGYTQPNAQVNTATDGSTNAVPGIELCGNGLQLSIGLALLTDGCTVKGIVANEFSRAGIIVFFSNNNVITGNFLGTDATGTQVKRNQSAINLT